MHWERNTLKKIIMQMKFFYTAIWPWGKLKKTSPKKCFKLSRLFRTRKKQGAKGYSVLQWQNSWVNIDRNRYRKWGPYGWLDESHSERVYLQGHPLRKILQLLFQHINDSLLITEALGEVLFHFQVIGSKKCVKEKCKQLFSLSLDDRVD